MRRVVWKDLGACERRAALARPEQRSSARLEQAVRDIVEEVQRQGWEGLCAIARRIDGAAPQQVNVARAAADARRRLPEDQVEAVEFAAARIRAFHEACVPIDFSMETAPGLTVRKTWRAMDRVGLYVPGGNTPLFSTLLMLAIPARAAGVGEIVAVTPPSPDGALAPSVALAAELADVPVIWTVGGAQAIAALAHGAGDIPRVDKICGPGNAWVAEAKRLVSSVHGAAAIDLPAGPSELMVIADAKANYRLVAADLLSQAEHDPAAQVLLVSTSAALAAAVESEIRKQVATLLAGKLPKRRSNED